MIVHFSVAVVPFIKEVIPLVSECSVVITAEPLTTLHVPMPMAATFALSVAVAELQSV